MEGIRMLNRLNWRRFAIAATVLTLSASAGFAGPANASHDITCDEDMEGPIFQGGEEIGVDVGPGLLFVGADIGGLLGTDIENFACVHSEALGPNILVEFDEDSPLSLVAAGCLVDVGGCKLSGIQVRG
jgi:hypothetical protein